MTWPTASLADVSKVFRDGDWIESKDQSSEGIRLVQTGNVGEGFFKDRRDKARFISEATFDRLNCTEVLPSDILMSRLPDPVGRSCIIPETGDKMITAVDCTIVRPDPERLHPSFLVYYSQSRDYQRNVEERCTGTTRKRISRKNLGRLPIPLPPLEEQKRIVAVLDRAFAALDRARALAEANLADAEELFENGCNEVFEALSAEFPGQCLADLASKITKGSSPKWQGFSYVEKPGILFVTSENVLANAMSFAKTKYVEEEFNIKDGKSILKNGDVLTNIVGASIGRTAVFERDDNANINQAVCLIRCKAELLRNHFLAYLLNSPYFKRLLHEGEVNMARANLSLTFFREFKVPLPPVPFQDEIVRKIDDLRLKAEAIQQKYTLQLSDLADLRQSILQKAFTGELT